MVVLSGPGMQRESEGEQGLPSGDEVARGGPARGRPHVDGSAFRALLNAGLAWLDRHHELVNALNVFPVPDGDTGTNMLLTMRSACQEIATRDSRTVGEVAKAAAQGALMGARGNSGVILSQILRGMARELEAQYTLNGLAFAAALVEGSRIAYRGVSRPVEGTILTVVREAAEAAQNAAEVDPDLRFVMARALKAADEAVANTPNLLPVLAQAGKVDSGGKGLYLILEGMYRALLGEVITAPEARAEALPAPTPSLARPVKGQRELPPLVYGFDVQFLVEGRGLDVEAIRQRITAMGECGLVEGNENLVKVHVHVPDPGVVLSYAVSLGFVTDVIVENMDDMYLPEMPKGYDPLPPRFAAPEKDAGLPPVSARGEERPIGQVTAAPALPTTPIEGPGIVAVVSGAGLAEVFRSLGTHIVVSGGQTMNPSTQELLAAVEQVPMQEVIILPNNGNIIMAAQQVQALSTTPGPSGQPKSVAVVPSRNIPQGISALLAYNPQYDLARNVERMTAALANVQTGEVTVAVQDARFNGIEIKAGDIIGLLNDMLTAKGSSSEEVVLMLLEQMGATDLEVITLYYGQPVSAEAAKQLHSRLSELFPDQEIELIYGGQPFYHYIISAE